MCVLHVQPIILLILFALQFKSTSYDSPLYTIFSALPPVPTYPRLFYDTREGIFLKSTNGSSDPCNGGEGLSSLSYINKLLKN